MSWFEALQAAAQSAARSLKGRGWEVRFGGPDESDAPIKTPQPARSEFLENRALGDWAESQLARALRDCGLQASHYGANDDIQSDEEGFKDFFRAQVLDVRRWGKRPDLIVAFPGHEMPHSIAQLPHDERDAFVRGALASIEVRCSRYKALQYMRLKAQRKAAKLKNVGQLAPNFTIKIEDLVILYRWVERHRIPQAYMQVFLDSAFGINVLSIFELVASWPRGLTLPRPAKSQGKPTIFIPITFGEQIGEMIEQPIFAADTKETPLGQVNAYVVPKGGTLRLDADRVLRVLAGNVRSDD